MARPGRSVTLVGVVALVVGLLVVGVVVAAGARDGDDGVAGASRPAAQPALPAERTVVAVRGQTLQLSGRCPLVAGAPLGPVEIHEVGTDVRVTRTDVTAASWTVEWRAPEDASTAALRVWCGDGGGLDFPADREISLRYRTDPPATTVAGRTLPPLPDT